MLIDPRLQYALQLAYGDRSLQASSVDAFPATLSDPNHTFFFEYDRKLTERADLVQAIRDHRQCTDPDNAIVWNFQKDADGWEAWNEIASFAAKDGLLQFHTTGSDAFIGGPFLRVKPSQLNRIEITMQVQANQPTINAALYWQTADMEDFSPDAQVSFTVTADNTLHTYTLKPNIQGSSPIARLRLDPANAPATLALKEIAVYCK